MEKKKILFVLPSLAGGGAERITVNMMNNLPKDKFKSALFLARNEGKYFDLIGNDIKVYKPQSSHCINKLQTFARLISIAKAYDTIVGGFELTPTYMAVAAAMLTKKKSVGWIHINMDSLLAGKRKWIALLHRYVFIPLFYRFADNIVAVSKGAANAFQKYLPLYKRKDIHCCYNPIEINTIREKSKQSVDRPNGSPIFIAVGRLEAQKNYSLMLDAMSLFVKRYPSAKLMILGVGSEERSLKNKVKDMKLEDSVKFMGFQANPYAYIAESDALVLSSRFEGLPTVLIEALTLQVPVVSVDCPDGINEILDNGKWGIIVENYNPEKLCEGMCRIIENDTYRKRLYEKNEDAVAPYLISNAVTEFSKFI